MSRFDKVTEQLRPINDKYGLPLALIALVISVIALVFGQ